MSRTSDFIVDLLAKWKVELTQSRSKNGGKPPLYAADRDATLLNLISQALDEVAPQYAPPPGLEWPEEFETIEHCGDKGVLLH